MENGTKKMRVERMLVVCERYDSCERGCCPIEHGFVEFVSSRIFLGNERCSWSWFNEEAFGKRVFDRGDAYLIDAILTEKGTLQRVKVVSDDAASRRAIAKMPKLAK